MAKPFKWRDRRDPLMVIAGKTKIQPEDVDAIALPILIALDAAKRGKAPNSLSNTLARNMLAAAYIMTKNGNKAMYDTVANAWTALKSACERPTQLLDLTTKEYQALRKGVSTYLRTLPHIEAAMLVGAYKLADERMVA